MPFVLQTIAAVGVVGYLSYRNGQQKIHHLASQQAVKVGHRIEQDLMQDLRTSAELARNTATVIELGSLNRHDRVALERLFEAQLERFSRLNAMAMLDEHQSLLAVEQQDGSTTFLHDNGTNDGEANRSLTKHLVEGAQPPAAFERQEAQDLDSWYLTVKSTHNSLWDVAEGLTDAGKPILTAVNVQPLRDRVGRFQGILAASTPLTELSHALENLKIAKTGQAFIVDQQGFMIASSNGSHPFRQLPLNSRQSRDVVHTNSTQSPELAYERLRAVKSYDPLTSQAARSILDRFDAFDQVQENQQFSLEVDHQRYVVQLQPLSCDLKLGWLAVVAVPEADFIDAIDGNYRLTILLCAGALIAAIAISWLTASLIAKPILRLSRASREVALGEWYYPLDGASQIAELEVLTHSFNQMAEHLQESFDQVKTALQESEAKFTKVFRASPDAITITTLPERRYLDVNNRFVEFTGYTRDEAIGQTAASLGLVINPEQIAHFEQALQTQSRVCDVEIDYRDRQGQARTVLVSAEVLELEGQTRLLCIYREITLRKQLELALHRSETKLNDILISAIASVTSIHVFPDGRWHYDYWSKGCETVFGYSPEAFLADQNLWISRVLPEDLERVLICNPKRLQTQETFVTQYRFWHKDGSLRWLSGYVTARWDEALNGWIATVVDVDVSTTKRLEAERRRAEAALRQSEATLREAQRVAHIGSWEFDVIAQTTRWSEELFQIHGLDPTQSIPSPVETLQFIHSDDRAALIELVTQSIADAKAYERDLRIVRPNGSIRYVEVRGMPLFDEQGTYIRMVGTTLDITKRKQAEEALRQSEQRFRNAFDTTAVSMCLVSPEGRFLQVNASMCQLLGYNEVELLSRTVANLTHPDDLDVTAACIEKLLAGEMSYYHLEKRYQHKDGHTIWCLLSVSLVRDRENQPLYFVAHILPRTHHLQTRMLAAPQASSFIKRSR
ncbi:MAG: PAS domain S-box protein [Leptolyngbya sp. BL-A-14]